MKPLNETPELQPYSFRLVGTTGCEILNPDGEVIAWAANEATAAVIVGLLNKVESDGLGM